MVPVVERRHIAKIGRLLACLICQVEAGEAIAQAGADACAKGWADIFAALVYGADIRVHRRDDIVRLRFLIIAF